MRAILIPALLAASAAVQAADQFSIDGTHSGALFQVLHFGAGYTYGRFNQVEGSLTWDAADPAKNAVKIEIQAGSIDTGLAKRDAHLKGDDFFAAKQHDKLSFVSSAWKKLDDGSFEVSGTLTIKGVAKPLTVKVAKVGENPKDPYGGHRLGLETKFTIKRSDFGITFMPDGIGDEVAITFGIEALKAK